jgi:hypothetical protein
MALYRLTARGTLPGEEFNFGVHADGPAGDASGAATAFSTALTAFWQDITDGVETVFSADVVVVVAHAAELNDVTQRQIDAAEVSVSLPGTDAADMLPHNCAVAVSTLAAAANRGNHGRFYLPPPSQAQISNGRLTSTPRARLLAGSVILINDLQGSGFTPVIRHHNGLFDPIARLRVGDVIDSQRRRRNKLVETYVSAGV